MPVSQGSSTTEVTAASLPTLQPQDDSSTVVDGNRPSAPITAAYRALQSPIDASSALWGAGRRQRIAELEAELRRRGTREGHQADQGSPQQPHHHHHHRRRRQQQQHRQQQQRGQQDARDGGDSKSSSPPRDITTTAGRRRPRPGVHDSGNPNSINSSPARTNEEAVPQPRESEDVPEEKEGRDDGRHGEPTEPGGVQTVGVLRLTLEQRLARWERGWRPPPLRELPRGSEGFFSGWTHMGQPERFELVKSANRSLGWHGRALTDAELEWAVLCLEEIEARMSTLEFSAAAGILESVLERCPGLTLAYYRLALCLLAARGAHASSQARRLLDCAMFLEGEGNPHLRAGVDLVLRMLRNDSIPEAYWSEDHPKSLGDLRALEAAVDQL